MIASLSEVGWVLDPPRETLKPELHQVTHKSTLWALLFSSIFSYALAKTLMAQPLHRAWGTPLLTILLSNFFGQLILFFLGVVILHRSAKAIHKEITSFDSWFFLGVVAFLPLHLFLPLALLCRPFGPIGMMVYSFCGLALWVGVIRRWAWGVQSFFGWPLWVASLVVLSPALLVCFLLLTGLAVFFVFISLVIIGMLT